MPIAVVMSVLVGVLFGLPVLGVRGDYLAVATMGLGEIVRVHRAVGFRGAAAGRRAGRAANPTPRIGSFVLSSAGARYST